jgi:hypothetical protein
VCLDERAYSSSSTLGERISSSRDGWPRQPRQPPSAPPAASSCWLEAAAALTGGGEEEVGPSTEKKRRGTTGEEEEGAHRTPISREEEGALPTVEGGDGHRTIGGANGLRVEMDAGEDKRTRWEGTSG